MLDNGLPGHTGCGSTCKITAYNSIRPVIEIIIKRLTGHVFSSTPMIHFHIVKPKYHTHYPAHRHKIVLFALKNGKKIRFSILDDANLHPPCHTRVQTSISNIL